MTQYQEIKARHPNAILFFRMGDFYEMFYDDAELASRVLGLTLTSRNNGGASEVPLAGVPVKAAAEYLRRLVQNGHRVAVCEQVEDPKLAKGIVRREVVETITPGAAFSDDLLESGRNNFLCAIQTIGEMSGIAAIDLSTGEFRLTICSISDSDSALARYSPREIIFSRAGEDETGQFSAIPALPDSPEILRTPREGWEFDPGLAAEAIARHFGVTSIEGFGLGVGDSLAVGAAGALLRYLVELQPSGVPHLSLPGIERPGGIMPIDEMTRRNLELVESLRVTTDNEGTLLGVLDQTETPMGARLLRQWVLAPLTSAPQINARLDAVEALFRSPIPRAGLRKSLDGVRDIERLGGKAAAGRSTPRDLRALGDSLSRLPEVARWLGEIAKQPEPGDPPLDQGTELSARVDQITALPSQLPSQAIQVPNLLAAALGGWDSAQDIATAIVSTLADRPVLNFSDGETIKSGVDEGLDELRAVASGGKDAIAALQAAERARTGISSLKVGYNRVFGYFIEVTNAHKAAVPEDYQRRQTLTGGERYVTPALKEFEEKVLNATERIEALEREIFEKLRAGVGAAISRLQSIATRIAQLDVVSTLAEVAAREGYVRPVVNEGEVLEIEGGRHPVVERMMPRDKFIPNNVRLAPEERMMILTGPNMAGKSTILRQTGLIVLMAQMGCYVPASAATIGVADRVFTRVGASDNLVRGQSTFMVEMAETSAILHTATSRSLVLLDEIGRGTATWDGLSIAWAVSEHLHENIQCKTVFATHYHELTQLADEFSSVRNFNVAVKEVEDRILFLHRLRPGGADRSYGIEVGRLAGLPAPVIARARSLLRILEGEQIVPALTSSNAEGPVGIRTQSEFRTTELDQLTLFGVPQPHPLVERLRDIDTDALTPMQALGLLAELAEESRNDTSVTSKESRR